MTKYGNKKNSKVFRIDRKNKPLKVNYVHLKPIIIKYPTLQGVITGIVT